MRDESVPQATPAAGTGSLVAKDPVCGMEVAPGELQVEQADVSYWFCSRDCLNRFVEEPELYTSGAGKGQVARDDRTRRDDKDRGALDPRVRGSLSNPPTGAGPG